MSTRCIVERADWDEVWDENTRLKAELRAARREAREWKAAHQYAIETIRFLSHQVGGLTLLKDRVVSLESRLPLDPTPQDVPE